ncbi:hypothetical protein ACI8AF_17345 [Blastococcus sp. SYSU D00669]
MTASPYLVERLVDPQRQVEVLVDGRWWPGVQRGWRMYDDGSGWRAAVSYVVETATGLEACEDDVPVGRFRTA